MLMHISAQTPTQRAYFYQFNKLWNSLGSAPTLMPGLRIFTHSAPSRLRSDLAAGLSLAAIALPVVIAYADLAGSCYMTLDQRNAAFRDMLW